MFAGDRAAGKKAARIANYLKSSKHLTHSRRIGINELSAKGVKILDTRTDQRLREAVWDVYLAIVITFDLTGAYKIYENHTGKALVRQLQLFQINPQPQTQPQTQNPPKQNS